MMAHVKMNEIVWLSASCRALERWLMNTNSIWIMWAFMGRELDHLAPPLQVVTRGGNRVGKKLEMLLHEHLLWWTRKQCWDAQSLLASCCRFYVPCNLKRETLTTWVRDFTCIGKACAKVGELSTWGSGSQSFLLRSNQIVFFSLSPPPRPPGVS